MQMIAAVNLDHIGACTAHIGAHGVEEVCQINHMGLFGRILNHGGSLRLHGRQHNVHCCTNGNAVKINIGPCKLVHIHIDHPTVKAVCRAERRKAFQVLIDGAHAEIAAARHGNNRMVKPAEQRAKQIIGTADLARQCIRRNTGAQRRGIHLDGGTTNGAHLGAHVLKDMNHAGNIRDVRNIFNAAHAVRKDSSGDNSQSSVLCAADRNFSGEPVFADNQKFIQGITLQSIYSQIFWLSSVQIICDKII